MLNKRTFLTIAVNAFLVSLALLLAYRMFAPLYEREQSSSLNTLGKFHTELAAERLASRITFLRDELKENALRLVDESRGPVFLDPARWLWMRVQDRDWRAPNYLDAFPAPKPNVDSWSLSAAKNSIVISQRVPIVKDGVQDFVLIEGGIKTLALNDLQNDDRFGLWLFDLDVYKKSGLGGAKLYERMSATGSLNKNEISLMTSDYLTALFTGKEAVLLPSENPWLLYFKKPTGSETLGVLGFWPAIVPPPDMFDTWATLLGILLVLSVLASVLLLKFLKSDPVVTDRDFPMANDSPKFATGLTSSNLPSAVIKDEQQGDIRKFVKNFLTYIQTSPPDQNETLKKVTNLLNFGESKLENIDFEILFSEYRNSDTYYKNLNSFFDPGLWRILTDPAQLKALLSVYLEFLEKHSAKNEHPRLSARLLNADKNESGLVTVKIASNFRTPFVRITLQTRSSHVLSTNEISSLFNLKDGLSNFENIGLALSLEIVENIQARILMRSSADDGHVLYVDIPATEARRPEDLIYIRQLGGAVDSPPANEVAASEESAIPAQPDQPVAIESNAEGTQEKSVAAGEVIPIPPEIEKPLAIADIKKTKSFAEDIGDDRSRIRSRFKIRKPGEKE